MAFRFKISHPKFTEWYAEPSPATAPLVMEQVRAVFPDAEVGIERESRADAKDAAAAADDLNALKEK